MSTISLRPVGEGQQVVIPSGKTTIGRGPFLTVTDKRVSRSHAVLEVSCNTFTVTPIHINPTFFKAQSNETYVPLVKDEAKSLENGNIISLLPDKLAFQVVIEDRSDQKNDALENGESKQEVSRKNTNDVKLQLSSSSSMATKAFDGDDTVQTTGETIDLPSSKTLEVTGVDKTDEIMKEQGDFEGVEPAATLEKTRVLPAWMRKEGSGAPATGKKTNQSIVAAEKKRKPECTKSATRDKKGEPEKTGSGRGHCKSNGSDEEVVLGEEDDEDEGEWELQDKKKNNTRSGKRNDFESDEDFIVDDDEEDEWRPSSQKKPRGTGRGKPRGRGATRGLGRGGGRARVKTGSMLSRMMTPVKEKDFINDDDDEDEEEESEEEEIKPKRKAKATPKKGKKMTPKKRIAKALSDSEEEYKPLSSAWSRKAQKMSDSEDDKSKVKSSWRKRQISDSEEEEDVKPKRKRSSRPVIAGDESEESDNVGEEKSLPSCPFGKRCYRKKPAHFREYSHPGSDESGEEDQDQGGNRESDPGSEGEGDSDSDDRPECQYGTSCYRTNAKHKKEFKHTRDPDSSRPKRTTAATKKGKKSVLDGEDDDDGEVNTYDYDDEEDSASSSASYGQDSEESDWRPDNDDDDDEEVEEDVKELVAEARGFLRSKRR